jgi:hypothetical protein
MTEAFTEQQLGAAARAVRSYDAVVVVGAGLSAYGYPMTAELPPLLWQAIEADPAALEELRSRTGRSGPVKEILSSAANVQMGWQIARKHAPVRRTFQHAFRQLDADRKPSQAHHNLARLIRLRRVEVVISYNWDTCLERAFKETYGIPIPPGILFKPHGDVAHPDAAWTFPDEDGIVPEPVLQKLAELRGRPRTLVVVGYSGSDEVVVEKLLRPLERSSPVVKVGPSAKGEGAVPGTADAVLAALLERLEPTNSLVGWRYINFQQSRGFGAALRGERLRPIDVDACPELPAAARLADRLRTSQFGTVSGASGSGKSITAFHAARRLNRDGWAIVELARPGVVVASDLADFKQIPGPVLAVVDDAQAIDPLLLTEFEACVDSHHAVLLVSTERLEIRGDETLIASQAQQIIFDYCKANVDAVGTLLAALDDRVGKSMFLESPAQRLELAQKTTSEPWVFMFVASGGDRRITSSLDRAVDMTHPAIVLALICIAQMTTQDAGITPSNLAAWVLRTVPELFAEDRDLQVSQFQAALRFLKNERLVSDNNGRLRASHIRTADRALRNLGQRTEANIGSTVMECVRQCLLDPEASIIGKFWVFRTFDRSEVYRYQLRASFLDDSVVDVLVDQCRGASPGRERGVALNLLWAVNFIRPLNDAQATIVAEKIIEWLPIISSDEVNGFRWVLNGLRSQHEAIFDHVRRAASARVLGQNLSNRGTRARARDWSDLLRELAPQSAPDFAKWREEFQSGVDQGALRAWLSDVDYQSQPFEIYDLISTLVGLAPAIALTAFKACSPNLKAVLGRDFADASGNFAGWIFGSMYYVASLSPAIGAGVDDEVDEDDDDEQDGVGDSAPHIDFYRGHEDELSQLAAEVLNEMRMVDWVAAAQSLEKKELYQLHNFGLLLHWLARLSVEIIDQIAEAISTDWLEKLAKEEMAASEGRTIDGLSQVLLPLGYGPRGAVVVQSFLEKHETEIGIFPAQLISRFPTVVATRALAGRPVAFHSPRGARSGWETCAEDLKAVAAVDREAGRRFLRASISQLREAIEMPQENDVHGIGRFIDLSDELDRNALDEVLGGLKVEAVQQRWRQVHGANPAAVEPLLVRTSQTASDIREFAQNLLDSRPVEIDEPGDEDSTAKGT